MKIILSRKGFDSGNAKMPSPVMPDGTPLSLPIPRGRGYCYSYHELSFQGRPLSEIIEELVNGALPLEDKAHADPDLDRERLPRKTGWRPIFGQAGGDQSHLENQGVGVGDLFLFFGWFRCTEFTTDGKLRFTGSRDGFHALFGWLQVGQVHRVNIQSAKTLPEWTLYHPHVASPAGFDANNTIYISAESLNLGGRDLPVPGAGTFARHTPILRLTTPDGPRSLWTLPSWFHPAARSPLSYHGDLSRWSSKGERTVLQSVARGQEFVLDTEYYPEAPSWIASLFEAGNDNAEQRRRH
jgi:hypothetical protein